MPHFDDSTVPTLDDPKYTFPGGALPTFVTFASASVATNPHTYSPHPLICPCCKRVVMEFMFGAVYSTPRRDLHMRAYGCAGGCYVTAIGTGTECAAEWGTFAADVAASLAACRATRESLNQFHQQQETDKLVARLERAAGSFAKRDTTT